MNLTQLSFKNVLARPLSALLSILLFGFGVAIIVSILLVGSFLKTEITKNAANIDLVIGAKGSPLQIILAAVFHVDYPTGNISLSDAHHISKNRLVDSAIPLALGDSHKGYRIVGTTLDYPHLYQAQLASGEWFEQDMSAVIGATAARELNLQVGEKITSDHGLSAGVGGHEDHPFSVAGVMHPTGTVLDGLILVSVASVWEVHGEHEAHAHEEIKEDLTTLDRLGLQVTPSQLAAEEITALLVNYRSPMAAVQLPRIVNQTSNLQAASPPYETARLFSIIGTGVEVVNVLGLVIVILSATSVFIALFNSLKERKYELAILRAMGASRRSIFRLIMTEGMILTLTGSLAGFAMAHLGFVLFGQATAEIQGSGFFFVMEEYYVAAGSLGVGIFASIIPALMAYQDDISKTLSKA